MTPIPRRAREKFLAKWVKKLRVNPSSGCWEWTGRSHSQGYAKVYAGAQLTLSRVVYATFYEDPGDRQVNHRCDNPPCVNPLHLVLGTPKQNSEDKWRRRRHPRPFGEFAPRAVLTDDEVEEIRTIKATKRELSELYGVSRRHIQAIRNGKERGS